MNIAAVVVTYNRLALLRECLDAFYNQLRRPNELIVVDNASSDGTKEYLNTWVKTHKSTDMKIVVLTIEKNEGGSGGFYAGTKRALDIGAEWVWVSDDDAIPDLDVFEKAEKHIAELEKDSKVSAICTQVQTDKKIATSNRGFRKKGLLKMDIVHVQPSEYSRDYFECNHFSYVGVLMRTSYLRKVGLIHPGYFIWRDDVEHSWRLSEVGKIICYPDMVVNHRLQHADYQGISWKTYYGYRNDLLMYKEHGCRIYYFTKTLTMIYKGFRSGNKKYMNLYLDAIRAARENESGLNSKYLPGTKI